jgi:hypothetical protein
MHEILDVKERLQRFLSVLQVEFKFPLEGLSEAELAIILGLLQFRTYAKGIMSINKDILQRGFIG